MRNVINAINVTTITNAVRTDRAVGAGMDTVRGFHSHYPRLHAAPALKQPASIGKRSTLALQGLGLGQPETSCLAEPRLWRSAVSVRSWSGSLRVRS